MRHRAIAKQARKAEKRRTYLLERKALEMLLGAEWNNCVHAFVKEENLQLQERDHVLGLMSYNLTTYRFFNEKGVEITGRMNKRLDVKYRASQRRAMILDEGTGWG